MDANDWWIVAGAKRRSRGGDEFRLIRRLAVLAALSLVLGLAFVSARAPASGPPDSARQTAGVQARLIAGSVLPGQLRPADLRSPVSLARRRRLDRLFRRQVLVDGIIAASLYGVHGVVTYSTDPTLIGQAAGPVLAPARAVARASVPIVVKPGAAGRFELERTQTVAVAGRSAGLSLVLVGAIAALALFALYIALLPVPRTIARRTRANLRRMDEMEHRAYHDALTDLPDRELLQRRVTEAIATARRDGASIGVMLMDLDRFKEINDTFGHQCGDQLLREVATDLRTAVRDQDTVARLGGDEFAILAAPLAGPVGAIAVAEQALREVQRSHQVRGVEVDVTASIGIALFPNHGQSVDELLRCADIAMYASKTTGVPTLYATELDNHSVARLALASQLRRAIEQHELAVHFQPKADLDTGMISSVEALVRWEHPEHGLLPPDRFIPVAEQTGLIRPLTAYVLDAALEQCRDWRRQGLSVGVAVNITGHDLLDQRFAEQVVALLRKWDVDPSWLELEITENTVLTDPVRARTVLMTLSALGVRLAIDDFGSGNSSLGYLRRLPIDVLKIDKSFVLQMHANDDDAVIVRSTIDLGHNLGLKVVAEGVSSVTAWDRLQRLGCDVAQGYYLSKPVPGSEVAGLIAEANERSLRSHHRHVMASPGLTIAPPVLLPEPGGDAARTLAGP